MDMTVTPGHPLKGELRSEIPGDKSLSHRAALFAALAEGESRIENFLVSGVTRAMLEALTRLGVPWRLEGTALTVQGRGLRGLTPPAAPLDCGNSATTLRMLAGALAAAGIPATLTGSPGLLRRPMMRIVEPLLAMGVPVEAASGGTGPLTLHARLPRQQLRGIDWTLPVASAQVKTCLLLAALAADGPTTLREPGPSRDHSERMLRAMGVEISNQEGSDQLSVSSDQGRGDQRSAVSNQKSFGTTLSPGGDGRPLQSLQMRLPGDFSAAAFIIVAALVTPGSDVRLRGIGLNPTRTGLLDALLSMGADIQVAPGPDQGGEPVGDLLVRHSRLKSTEVGGPLVVRMIDEFPAFAAAAACAQGTTRVCDAAELRHKESDRITALCQELLRLGVQAGETPDGFTIQGGRVPGGARVDPHGDHRLAMALAVTGLAAEDPITVQNASILNESFPAFPTALASLGAEVTMISDQMPIISDKETDN